MSRTADRAELRTMRCVIEDRVAWVTLDRPPYNAMTELMVREAYETLTRLANDDSVGIVVLTGAGRAFCPGADLDHVASGEVDAELSTHHYRCAALLHEMPQVSVAAVNGACAGAALGWAVACDLRVAARSAKFRTAFLDVHVAGDMGGPWTLSRAIGGAWARQLYFEPDKFSADEALRLGVVTKVFDDDEFDDRVRRLVQRLAAAAPSALRDMKANFVAAERMTLSDYVDLETERHHRLLAQPDTRPAFRTGSS